MVASEAKVDLSVVLPLARQYHDEGYAQFICKYPFSFYVERVKRIGFVGRQHVLDAGSGFGQWTAALALLNERVVALEQNQARLSIARELMNQSGIHNVEFVLGDAVSLLDREDCVFDAVFCYGVFMFLDRRKAIKEFRRVLKPGGDLYICTNGFGWWLRLWLQYLFRDRNVRLAAYTAMTRGNKGGIPNYTNRKEVPTILKPEEWDSIKTGYEGTLSRPPGNGMPLPVYRGTFFGFDSVIEFLAKKRPSHIASPLKEGTEEQQREAVEALQQVVLHTLSKRTYEYFTPLRELPQPRPALDLVHNCFADVVEHALLRSRSLNRVKQLQWMYQKITEHCSSQYERIRSCVTFAQCRFFHHFAGQPMQSENVSVLDPVAAVMLRFGRCGASARFMVDLFECNGIRARLLTAGCHTSAEVLHEGRWLLVDASLFPPGLHPVDEDGSHITIEQVVKSPLLLDRCPSYINYHHEYIDAFIREYPESASAIERQLRAPLLPSSGYFGGEYFFGRNPGQIERLSKLGCPEDWNADEKFGWLLGYERETIQGPVLPSRQRPGQVTNLYLKRGYLCWDQPFGVDPATGVSYHLILSKESRGWDYTQLPVGCPISVTGHSVRTEGTRIEVGEIASLGRYLTIFTEVSAWQAEPIFYLPSKEFDWEGFL